MTDGTRSNHVLFMTTVQTGQLPALMNLVVVIKLLESLGVEITPNVHNALEDLEALNITSSYIDEIANKAIENQDSEQLLTAFILLVLMGMWPLATTFIFNPYYFAKKRDSDLQFMLENVFLKPDKMARNLLDQIKLHLSNLDEYKPNLQVLAAELMTAISEVLKK